MFYLCEEKVNAYYLKVDLYDHVTSAASGTSGVKRLSSKPRTRQRICMSLGHNEDITFLVKNHIHSFNHAFSCGGKSMNVKRYVFLFTVYIINIKFNNVYPMLLQKKDIAGTSDASPTVSYMILNFIPFSTYVI